MLGHTSSLTASSMASMGSALADSGDKKQAIQYYEQSLAIKRSLHNTSPTSIAITLNNLGNALLESGNPKEAMINFEQSLDIMLRHFGNKPNIYVPGTMNNMGAALASLGELDKAITYYMRVIETYKVMAGDQSLDIAHTLNNLGNAYWYKGDLQTAIQYYENSLVLKKRVYGEKVQNTDIASTINNLGRAWYDLNMISKALVYYEEALSMYRHVFGDDKKVIDNNMARLMNNYNKAKTRTVIMNLSKSKTSQISDGMTSTRSFFDDSNIITFASQGAQAKALICRAEHKLSIGVYDEASDLVQAAISILERQIGYDDEYKQAGELQQTVIRCLMVSESLKEYIIRKEWSVLKSGLDFLIYVSPKCIEHRFNYAHCLLMEAYDKNKSILSFEETQSLITQADEHYRLAVSIEEKANVLVDYAQFLYLQGKIEWAKVYLALAINNADDVNILRYSIIEEAFTISILRELVAKSLSVNNLHGNIFVHPIILAYTLLVMIAIKQTNEIQTQDIELGKAVAKGHIGKMIDIVYRHPTAVHYALVAYALRTIGLVSLAGTYERKAESRWQIKQSLSEERIMQLQIGFDPEENKGAYNAITRLQSKWISTKASDRANIIATARNFLEGAITNKEKGLYQEALALLKQATTLLSNQQPKFAKEVTQVINLQKSLTQCIQLQSLLQRHITMRDWAKVKMSLNALIKVSPSCVSHHIYLARSLHMEAMEMVSQRKVEDMQGLLLEAEKNFHIALQLSGHSNNTDVLAEFGLFLYMNNRQEDARRYLNGALGNEHGDEIITYSAKEKNILIPILQTAVDRRLALGKLHGEIHVRPRVLAYTLLLLITTEIHSETAYAKEYLSKMLEEVHLHPSAVHYDLLAYACEKVGLANLAKASQVRAEYRWQAQLPLSEERKLALEKAFNTQPGNMALTQRQKSWRERIMIREQHEHMQQPAL